MPDLFSDADVVADDALFGASRSRRINFDVPRAAAAQVATWALDVAADSTDDPEDIERIGRVRRFVHSVVDGKPTRIPTEEDLLSVLAIVIAALELDCAAPGLGRSVAVVIEEMDPFLAASCGQVLVPVRVGRGGVSLGARGRGPAIVRHRYCVP